MSWETAHQDCRLFSHPVCTVDSGEASVAVTAPSAARAAAEAGTRRVRWAGLSQWQRVLAVPLSFRCSVATMCRKKSCIFVFHICRAVAATRDAAASWSLEFLLNNQLSGAPRAGVRIGPRTQHSVLPATGPWGLALCWTHGTPRLPPVLFFFSGNSDVFAHMQQCWASLKACLTPSGLYQTLGAQS